MEQEEMVERWLESAKDDLVTAEDNFKLGHYDWCLYMGQLSLEKLLKGLYLKNTGLVPPFIHDLNKLAKKAAIELSDEQFDDFAEMTTYHIKARYEEIKSALYHKATEEYTTKWLNKIKDYSLWLQSLY